MTCSMGFRVSSVNELAREMLQRLGEDLELPRGEQLYSDAGQPATDEPARMPAALQGFAAAALQRALDDPAALARALGSLVSEPKAQVWFEPQDQPMPVGPHGLRLDRRTRMMYDDRHVFINGEAFRAGGRDARLMARLANHRCLSGAELARLSPDAHSLVSDWWQAGWLQSAAGGEELA